MKPELNHQPKQQNNKVNQPFIQAKNTGAFFGATAKPIQKKEDKNSEINSENKLSENNIQLKSSGGDGVEDNNPYNSSAPLVGLNQAPIQGIGLSNLFGKGKNGVQDALNMRDNEKELDLQEDIKNFKSQKYGPITYTRDGISGSGFETYYVPNKDLLNVEVRSKVRFADGLVNEGGTISSPNYFMNQGRLLTTLNAYPDLANQVLPYFQWNSDEKQIHLIRFKDNIQASASVWQDTGMSFQVNEIGWENVKAKPRIDLKIAEGEAINAKKNYGPFGILTKPDKEGSDHLQIEVVKKISHADARTVNTLIQNYLNAAIPGTDPISNVKRHHLTPNYSSLRGVRSYLGNNPDKKNRSKSEGHNNFMSLESDRSDNPVTQTFNHKVLFENGASTISSSAQTDLDNFFSNPSILLKNPNGTVKVALHGYASAPGSTASNTQIVQQRLTAVADAINQKMDGSSLNIKQYVNPSTQTNNSDSAAEADLASNPAHNPADFRRVDIKIEQSGRGGQNVLAHEFGHVFGLGDEYAEVGSGYNRPAGSAAHHDQLAKDAGIPGGAVVRNDSRMMSTGNDVKPAHYSTFAETLKQLTSKKWKIVP